MLVARGPHKFRGIDYTTGQVIDVGDTPQYLLNNLISTGFHIDVSESKAQEMRDEYEKKKINDLKRENERKQIKAFGELSKAKLEADRLERLMMDAYVVVEQKKKEYQELIDSSSSLVVVKKNDSPSIESGDVIGVSSPLQEGVIEEKQEETIIMKDETVEDEPKKRKGKWSKRTK